MTPPPPPPQRVLVAINGSPASLEASRFALELAAAWRGAVRAVAVVGDERAERLVDEAAGGGEAPAHERRRAALEDALAHVVRAGQSAGITVEQTLLVRPRVQPYEVILDEADHWPADVIVVGRGHHHGIGRALLGSQTEHVLEFATRPVIVVPARSP